MPMVTLREQIAEAQRELALRRRYEVVCWTCQRRFLTTRRPKPGDHFYHACSPACRQKGRLLRVSDRLWRHIVQEGECWIWTKGCSRAGYGYIGIGRTKVYVHTLVYERTRGPVP